MQVQAVALHSGQNFLNNAHPARIEHAPGSEVVWRQMAALEQVNPTKRLAMLAQMFKAFNPLVDAGMPVAQLGVLIPQLDFKKDDRDTDGAVHTAGILHDWMHDPTKGKPKVAAYA